MPQFRPCRVIGCGGLTKERNGFCDKHQGESWQQHQAKRTPTQRGYGPEWRKLRALIMERDGYLCQECKRAGYIKPAYAVDHIKSKGEGGTDDPQNLEAICKKCHYQKTSREALAGRRKYKNL